MEFRTEVRVDPSHHPISYASAIAMFGSCFSDSAAQRLSDRFFSVMANPLGTLYNPASIADCLDRIAECRLLSADDLFASEGRFHTFACHSSLSMTDHDEMLSAINSRIESAHRFIESATHLIITSGTAWVYRLASTGRIVANCHKQPSSMLSRSMLSPGQCAVHLAQAIESARRINPTLTIILTVSPIRHLSDGAHGNNLSKSTLLLACDRIAGSISDTEYFPAYEIVMDDLRDYRFYAPDMCHPSDQAVDYVFSKFSEAYCSTSTQALAKRCLKLRKRLDHRQMTTDPATIARFNDATASLARTLAAEHPALLARLQPVITHLSQETSSLHSI